MAVSVWKIYLCYFFQLVLIFGPFWVIFGLFWVILDHFWAIFFVLIFWVKKLVGANFLRFCNSAAWADWHSKVNQEIGQNTNIILMHGSLSGALDHEDWGFSLRTPSSQTQFIKIFSSKWQVMQRNFKVVSLITSPLLPLRHKTMICCFLRTLCVVLLFQNCLHQSCSFLILLTSSAPPPLLSPE